MANCPKCNNRHPFLKVGFLSKIRNKFRCKSCDTIIEADKSFLGVLGGLGGSIAGALMIWNKEIFGNQPLSFLMAIASTVVLLIIAAFIQNSYINLTIAENQNDESFKEEEIKIDSRPPLPKNATRVEYLKNKYHNKSDSELVSIANASDNEMTKEAQEAAKKLLNERKNIT